MEGSTITVAIQKKKEKARVSDEDLYKYVCDHAGLSTYELAKKMKWTVGKTNGALQRLTNTKLIYHKAGIVDNRVKYSWYAYTVKERLTKQEIKDLKEISKRIKTYEEYLAAYE